MKFHILSSQLFNIARKLLHGFLSYNSYAFLTSHVHTPPWIGEGKSGRGWLAKVLSTQNKAGRQTSHCRVPSKVPGAQDLIPVPHSIPSFLAGKQPPAVIVL